MIKDLACLSPSFLVHLLILLISLHTPPPPPLPLYLISMIKTWQDHQITKHVLICNNILILESLTKDTDKLCTPLKKKPTHTRKNQMNHLASAGSPSSGRNMNHADGLAVTLTLVTVARIKIKLTCLNYTSALFKSSKDWINCPSPSPRKKNPTQKLNRTCRE